MIHDVDEALRALIKRDALNGADVEIVFDAPTKDWAARRNTPTLDVYLYDIREDLKWRAYGEIDLKNDAGRTSARQGPPRYFKLSYLVTAWTQRPEDEHRLLSAVLLAFLRATVVPRELLPSALQAVGVPVRTTIALPPPQDRSISDVWSALGGELKPSLDLVCLVAIDVTGEIGVAPLITEQPRFAFADTDRLEARARRSRLGVSIGDRSGGAGDGEQDDSGAEIGATRRRRRGQVEEEFAAAREGEPGRRYFIRQLDED